MNLTGVRVVAVGDSLSEGVGDPDRAGLRGWVHYLTGERTGLELEANLARSGATVAAVRRHQLDRAVALAPDVVTCVVGVNDVITRRFDAAAFARDYDVVVGALARAAGTGVLTMTLHDVAAFLPLPRGRREELRRRIARANEVVEEVSARHGTWVLDARAVAGARWSGMLSVDRLHPNRRGHRYIAAIALDLLRARGVCPVEPGAEVALAEAASAAGALEAGATPTVAVPEADPPMRRIAAEARHLWWLGRHLATPLLRAGKRPSRL